MQSHSDIRSFLKPGMHAHLVGIGGVSMRPLGLVLHSIGMTITGSDMNSSVSTADLESQGIPSVLAIVPKTLQVPTVLSAPQLPTTTILRSPQPEPRAFRSLSAPRPGVLSCRAIKTLSASPARMGKPQPPLC